MASKKAKTTPKEAVGTSPTPHKLTVYLSTAAIVVSIVSVMVSVGSAYISLKNYLQTRAINRLNVKPEIVLSVRRNTLPKWSNAPASELLVLNRGPIKAVSVYVDYKVWPVDTNLWWPGGTMGVDERLRGHYNFVLPDLDVGQGRIKSVLSLGPVAIYDLTVSFYHPNDMEKYVQTCKIFYWNEHYYTEDEFKTMPFFPILMRNLNHALAHEKGELPAGHSEIEDSFEKKYILVVPDDLETPRSMSAGDFL